MATSSASSILNFVKKYPITLCGFSLLFMPSVHRLLLYFTPLLLSTAIFIVAMLTWGPAGAMPSDQRGKTRGRRNDWAFNGSLKIYEGEEEEGEEEEEEEVAAEVPQRKINDGFLQERDISIKRKESKKFAAELQEPDPDFDEESNRVGTTSTGAIFRGQAEPDPDLGGDCLGTTSCGEAEPDPDLHGAGVVSHAEPDLAGGAELDPDLHGEQHDVEAAHDQDFSAEKYLHAAPDHHHHHHLHDHAKRIAPISPDQQAAGDHLDLYHDVDGELDHLHHHVAERNHVDDYDDAESDHVDDYHDAEPDPDLHGEGCTAGAVHAKSEGAHDVQIENDDPHAAIFAELRQKLGVIKRAPYSDDARDHMHSQKLVERLQTLQAAA